jgi:hypothetical protein
MATPEKKALRPLVGGCSSPVWLRGQGMFVACGKCPEDHEYSDAVWKFRCSEECKDYPDGEVSFVTLTYADEHVPGPWVDEKTGECYPAGSLNPRDRVLFMKRLRWAFRATPLKFFAVGEYGDRKDRSGEHRGRPHWHIIVYGLRCCRLFTTHHARDGKTADCCDQCKLVTKLWGRGRVSVDVCTPEMVQYVTTYMTGSKLRKGDRRLCGRYPEHRVMSRRPALGHSRVEACLGSIRREAAGCRVNMTDYLNRCHDGDVPKKLRVGGRVCAVGSYFVRRMRRELGEEWADSVGCERTLYKSDREKGVTHPVHHWGAPKVVRDMKKVQMAMVAYDAGMSLSWISQPTFNGRFRRYVIDQGADRRRAFAGRTALVGLGLRPARMPRARGSPRL